MLLIIERRDTQTESWYRHEGTPTGTFSRFLLVLLVLSSLRFFRSLNVVVSEKHGLRQLRRNRVPLLLAELVSLRHAGGFFVMNTLLKVMPQHLNRNLPQSLGDDQNATFRFGHLWFWPRYFLI